MAGSAAVCETYVLQLFLVKVQQWMVCCVGAALGVLVMWAVPRGEGIRHKTTCFLCVPTNEFLLLLLLLQSVHGRIAYMLYVVITASSVGEQACAHQVLVAKQLHAVGSGDVFIFSTPHGRP